MSTDQRYFTVKTTIQYGKVKQFQLVLIITSISVMIHLVVICCQANTSYGLDDPHLFTAREFYNACLKGSTDSASHVAEQFRQLISMLFGEWDLLTSSTNMTNAYDGARNILNLSLTDLYLPLLSTTGHSPLFSLDIDEEDRAIRIDWDYLFDKLFNQTGFRNFHKLPVKVEEKHALQYFCAFHEIQLETDEDKSSLYNLAILNFLAEQERRLLNQKNFDSVHKSNTSNTTYFSPYCMDRVKIVFPWTLEKHFLTSRITQNHRNEVQQLVEEMKSSIFESVTQATWLDDSTKQFFKDKISQTKAFILYSNVNGSERREDLSEIYRYPINAEDHILNEYYAQKSIYSEKLRRSIKKSAKMSLRDSPSYLPEAYYLKNLNRIYIFAGLMQPPFYEKDEDLSTRYNGLGWIIAHELLHGIDLIGVLEDINGNQRSAKDSYAGLIANMRQTDCLRSHYKNHSDSFEKSDRIGTRNEILADNGGLKIMYNTYRKLQNRQRVQNSSEILASDRLFFLRFAQTLCGRVHKDSRQYHKDNINHILPRYRLIGALSNNEEFAKAYNCPIGSPMNPLKKCKLW
ncbi:unnamed protein product [Schistosoma margrebowiei]|uniref:Peptidase M13 C-terminal domain-containing protein n=1 Tax=Schistosoma margrebowiei TaxID=48269 RepID=A0AA84ZWR5_9TREM|nr:unnamed protein product [Schistosoma margrebowiei]